jgi:hypothetical protein
MQKIHSKCAYACANEHTKKPLLVDLGLSMCLTLPRRGAEGEESGRDEEDMHLEELNLRWSGSSNRCRRRRRRCRRRCRRRRRTLEKKRRRGG